MSDPVAPPLSPADALSSYMTQGTELTPESVNQFLALAGDTAPEEAYKLLSSKMMESYLGMSAQDIYMNWDAAVEAWSGQKEDPRGFFEKVKSAWNGGAYSVKLGRANWDLVKAVRAGDDEAAAAAEAEIAKIKTTAPDPALIAQALPKTLWGKAGLTGKKSLYGGVELVGQMTNNTLAGIKAGIEQIKETGIYYPGIFLAEHVGGTFALEAGLAYNEMMEWKDENGQGIDKDTAVAQATGIGALNTLVESSQEIIMGLAGTVDLPDPTDLVEGAITKGIKKLIGDKTLQRITSKAAKTAVKGAAYLMTESGQEVVQEFTTVLLTEAAKDITNELNQTNHIRISPDELRDRLLDTWSSSMLSFAALGGVSAGSKAALRTGAKGAQKGVLAASRAIGSQVKKEDAQAMEAVRAAFSPAPADDGREIDRTKTGGIRTQAKDVSTTEGQAGVIYAGAATTGERYGYARYRVDGDRVVIEDLALEEDSTMPPDMEGEEAVDPGAAPLREGLEVRKALLEAVAAENPGLEIDFEPRTSMNRAAMEAVIAENPRGKEAGLQWYAADDDLEQVRDLKSFKAKMASVFKHVSANQIDVIGDFVSRRAARVGLTPDAYVRQSFTGQAFTSTLPSQVDLSMRQTGTDPKRVNGTTVFRDARALIYAAENADFRTLQHEMMHAWHNEVLETGGADRVALEQAFGVTDGKWDAIGDKGVTKYEELAYSWEKFLETGEAKTPAIKSLLQKIAAWMKSAYENLSRKINVTPEIREAFEQLFADPESVVNQAEAAVAAEAQPTKDSIGDMPLFQERDVENIVYSFPPELKGYSDIHSPAQVSGILNVFGRGVVDKAGNIRLGDAGSSHVGLAQGMQDAKWFYYGYSRDKKAAYLVAKNGIDEDFLKSPKVQQAILSQVFDKYRLGVAQGKRLAFRDVLFQEVEETRDEQGRLLAPNGVPSKLTDFQWKQVRTPAFKKWFGDWEEYPLAGDASEGLRIKKQIDNLGSIGSSLQEYRIEKGVRIVPLSSIENTKTEELFYAIDDIEKTKQLAEEIKSSGEISPVILVKDDKGFYILEGVHRIGALDSLGKKTVPAIIVIDEEKETVVSKAVDLNGEPEVYYHGTKSPGYDAFSREKINTNYEASVGFHFSNRSSEASGYAIDPETLSDTGAGVYAVFLKIDNPITKRTNQLNASAEIDGDRAFYVEQIIESRKTENPHDGIIITAAHGTIDDGSNAIVFKPSQIKSAIGNIGAFNPADDRILFQEIEEEIQGEPSMLAIHYIDRDHIATMEEFGGMPSPSIAYTKPNIPFEDYGDVSLILKKEKAIELINQQRVYDRDIYSPSLPAPDYKIDKKKEYAFDREMQDLFPNEERSSARYAGFSLMQNMSEGEKLRGPSATVKWLDRSYTTRIAYLRDQKGGYKIPQTVKKAEIEINESSEFRSWVISGFNDMSSESEREGDAKFVSIQKRIYKESKERPVHVFGDFSDNWKSYKNVHFATIDKIYMDAKEYGAKIVNESRMRKEVDKRIRDDHDGYIVWLTKKITPMYSEPRIKVNGRIETYNARNVQAWMETQGIKASQKTMTYGPGKAQAMAAISFYGREMMKDDEKNLVTKEQEQAFRDEKIEPLEKIVREQLPEYTKDDTWDALDNIYRAIADYYRGGKTVSKPERMRKSLSANGFHNVPADLIETTTKLAHAMQAAPVQYFEGKPDEVLTFNDFAAAIVPKELNHEAREGLERAGTIVYEYGDKLSRNQVVKAIAEKEAASSRTDQLVLFQLADDELSTLAAEAENWEDFRDRVEAEEDADSPTKDLSPEERDFWYQAQYERLTNQAQEAKTLTPEAADEAFADRIPGELEGFLKFIYDATVTNWSEMAPEDAAEAAAFDERMKTETRLQAQAHPTVLMAARTIGQGRELTEQVRKSVLTLMRKKGARTFYRRWYATLTGDKALAVDEAVDAEAMPDIEDLQSMESSVSIESRLRILEKVQDTEIRRKLASGEIVIDSDVADYVERLEKEKATVDKELAEKEAQYASILQDLKPHERRELTRQKWRSELKKKIESQSEELRKGLEAGTIDEALLMERNKNREYLEEIESKGAPHAAVARTAEIYAIEQAVKETKLHVKDIADRKKNALQIRNLKIAISDAIMRKIPKGVSYERVQEIQAIQGLLDPHFRRAKVEWNAQIYTLEEARKDIAILRHSDFPKEIADRLTKKNLGEWTLKELEELALKVDEIVRFGKQERDFEIFNWQVDRLKSAMTATRAVIAAGRYKNAEAAGSQERLKQMQKLDTVGRRIYLMTENARRVARQLDGGVDGKNVELLILERRRAEAAKMAHVDRRIESVHAAMKQAKVSIKDLYRKKVTIVGVGAEGRNATFTISDLMYIYLGLKDGDTQNAILYGNFMNQGERAHLDKQILKMNAEEKLSKLKAAIATELGPEFRAVAEIISQDFTDEFGRMNEVFIREFNRSMGQVAFYVPMIRQDTTSSGEKHESQQAKELLQVGGITIKAAPEKGFTVERVKIGPQNQRAIKLDLYGTWLQAVDREEHFTAYTHHIRTLNAVYKGMAQEAKLLRDSIVNSYGSSTMKYVDEYINEIANPQTMEGSSDVDKIARLYRGSLYSGYLGLKASSLVKQAITSPLPYLAYVSPLDMANAAFEATLHHKDFEATVNQSTYMKHRTMSPAMADIKKAQQDPSIGKGIAAFNELSMKGFGMVDWAAVAIGWKAVYNRAAAALAGNHETVRLGDAEYRFVEEANSDAKAWTPIEIADDITLKSQPTGDAAELSPLFKMKGKGAMFLRAFTQFQSALNVIWQNFTSDIPNAIKHKHIGYALRAMTSYAIAGILVGVIMKGKEDDDDDLKDDYLFWSMTQATDSTPLIGNYVTNLWRRVVTGETEPVFQSSLYPAADEAFRSAKNVLDEDWEKAAQNFAEAFGLAFGLPVSGAKEIKAAIEIGPQAFIGRRE